MVWTSQIRTLDPATGEWDPPMIPAKEITVTVTGPVGCGKSAIAGEIEIALRAVGVPVRYADDRASRSEKNMTGADWQSYLEMYNPSVVLVEQIAAPKQSWFALLRAWIAS